MSRMRSVAWPGIAVMLAGIALLMAFQKVVRAGVQQGETRRHAVAMRADCLLQLDSSPRDAIPLPTEHAAAIVFR